MFSIQQKLEHLKTLGINGNLAEIEKMYKGESFNTYDANYQKLLTISKKLCNEFNTLSGKLTSSNEIVANMASKRQKEILDTLFPGHGMFFGGRDRIFAVVGLVDIADFCYLNGNIDFGTSNKVVLEPYVFLAQNLTFGNPLNVDIDGKSKLDNIVIRSDTWVGANCSFDDGVEVLDKCVVAMGSHLTKQSKQKSGSLILSRRKAGEVLPAQSFRQIDEQEVSKNIDLPFDRSEQEVQSIINHVKSLGIDGDFSEYKKLLHNQTHNSVDPTVAAIFDYTHKLCSEYNFANPTQKRKQEILDALFPFHGKNFRAGNMLVVDVLGSVEICDNVCIGDNVSLAGNISLGNNVKVGDNVVLQGIGHHMYYQHRRMPTDGTFREDNTMSGIFVCDDVVIADGTLVVPNVRLNRNTKRDELVTPSKLVQKINNKTVLKL